MIKQEETVIGERTFLKTWSDDGVYIKDAQGRRFIDVLDPADFGRSYEETDEPIPRDDDATEADKDAALRRFGVEVDK